MTPWWSRNTIRRTHPGYQRAPWWRTLEQGPSDWAIAILLALAGCALLGAGWAVQ